MSQSSSESIIEIRGLKKSFGSKPVLKGVDFQIDRGQVVGLLGANGSGKSTLIKCLLGLLRTDGGSSQLFGEPSWSLSAAAKARLGYVPQEVRLFPWMTVNQVLDYTAAFYELWDADWVQELQSRWGLDGSQKVQSLSVGQNQKLGLILAMGHRPELLILDEPVASLDPLARREFLRSILEVTVDERHTVLFSTHITSDLERVASHVALLQHGQMTVLEELDHLKDRVKRLRIEAAQELPLDLKVPGALRTEVFGQRATVSVEDAGQELVQQLEHRWQASVRVEDLNLEEIFLELHHG